MDVLQMDPWDISRLAGWVAWLEMLGGLGGTAGEGEGGVQCIPINIDISYALVKVNLKNISRAYNSNLVSFCK